MSYRRCLSLKVHPNAFSLIVAGVKVSNAERIIDEATGIRKIDLVRYYDEIAEFALPYLRDRPVSLVRAPSGIQGERFFQKHEERAKIPGITRLPADVHAGHQPLLVQLAREGWACLPGADDDCVEITSHGCSPVLGVA
ncbi:hypothetical protein [Caballeronia arationis]|jgi:bifunctional non-homologous end joining protein LigD|uniref:non-homologous end-joining DNA ligase LigD n=1 Tax=Caballeronia arationis TaxID=1777142 RepID=UPI001FC95620|nr:hypothetical protein [Caballeronia arationis]